MKLFVTGGTGFLGKAVVSAALDAGHEVRAMVRDARARLDARAEKIEVRLDDAPALREHLRGVDAIVHLAGKVSRDPRDSAAMHAVHVEGTVRLLDAAEAAGVRRVVLASTSGTIAVSEDGRRLATEEDTPPFELIGRWPYYTSKHLQEQEVLRRDRADRVEAVILNPSLLLGPGDDRMSSTGDVLDVLTGNVPALTEGTVAFVDVRDCTGPFLAALERGRRGQRYLLNGANMKVRSFAERVALAGDVSAPRVRLSATWARRSARLLDGLAQAVGRDSPVQVAAVDMATHHWGCNAAKARRELGFAPRDPQETIVATVRDLETRGLFRRVRA
jgi:dihydroflavonol-4-reductase